MREDSCCSRRFILLFVVGVDVKHHIWEPNVCCAENDRNCEAIQRLLPLKYVILGIGLRLRLISVGE